MRFHILTIFPRIFDSYVHESLFKRALQNGLIEINTHNLRDFTADRHNKVDAKPFGGGPGMVLQVEPIYRAVTKLLSSRKKLLSLKTSKLKTRIILFSTRGKKLDAKAAKRLSKYDELILICGRYEGVDERVAEHVAGEELSIGEYVLSGGELPALVTIEAVSRFLPGFLGKIESLEEIKGSYPVYARPPEFSPNKKTGSKNKVISWKVPAVLMSGNHKEIELWRKARSKKS